MAHAPRRTPIGFFVALTAGLWAVGCNCGSELRQLEGQLDATPQSLDFGEVTVATRSVLTVTLSNPGEIDVKVTSVTLEPGSSEALTAEVVDTVIPSGGGGVLLQVAFAP